MLRFAGAPEDLLPARWLGPLLALVSVRVRRRGDGPGGGRDKAEKQDARARDTHEMLGGS